MLAKIKSNRRSRQQRMRWLDSITDSIDMNWSKFQGTVEDRGAWSAAVHGVIESRIWLSDRTTTSYPFRRADIRGREVTSWFPKIFTISCTVNRGKDQVRNLTVLVPWRWLSEGWVIFAQSYWGKDSFIYLVDSLTWWQSKVFNSKIIGLFLPGNTDLEPSWFDGCQLKKRITLECVTEELRLNWDHQKSNLLTGRTLFVIQ